MPVILCNKFFLLFAIWQKKNIFFLNFWFVFLFARNHSNTFLYLKWCEAPLRLWVKKLPYNPVFSNWGNFIQKESIINFSWNSKCSQVIFFLVKFFKKQISIFFGFLAVMTSVGYYFIGTCLKSKLSSRVHFVQPVGGKVIKKPINLFFALSCKFFFACIKKNKSSRKNMLIQHLRNAAPPICIIYVSVLPRLINSFNSNRQLQLIHGSIRQVPQPHTKQIKQSLWRHKEYWQRIKSDRGWIDAHAGRITRELVPVTILPLPHTEVTNASSESVCFEK